MYKLTTRSWWKIQRKELDAHKLWNWWWKQRNNSCSSWLPQNLRM